jgi:endonuclease/exonuclease/phosphatase family metal-dependent hydrolase
MENSGFLLRVMSFNIRTTTARDLRHAWDLRKHLVIQRIRHFDPDLLGMQECQDGEQADFIREALPDYAFIAKRRGDDSRSGREMAPLLFRKEAFDLLDSGHFWLSKTPDTPGSKLLGTVYPRTVTWARLRPVANPDRDFFFFNTHFDYIVFVLPSAAQVLRERILQITRRGATVLCGDFNSPSGGAVHRLLTAPFDEEQDRPLDDMSGAFVLNDVTQECRTTSGEPAGTIHKFGLITVPIIIDWILASSHFTVVDAAIDDYNDNGLYPSDHYPVTAVLNAEFGVRRAE